MSIANGALRIALCTTLFAATAVLAQDAPTAALPQGAAYVALGSSFAAGPGIETQLGTCGRSDHNYPNLVANALNLSLTDVSCSGATTANILDTEQAGAAPQIEAVSANTALVTVTIGGNDIQFTRSTGTCAGTAPAERCTEKLDQAAIAAAVTTLPARLAAVLDAIEARAPQAIVVLVTYPRVFPPDASSCGELALSAQDTAYLAALGQELEDAFLQAVAGRKTLLADAYSAADGHGPCAAGERWVNGARVRDSGASFHPTAEGHVEMARLVLAALANN
jgi:lysophospholipase L1-like esterase